MVRLTIDGAAIEVPDGATVLDAARQAGAAVPTLCYLKETGALTTCMVCVVRDLATGRLLPACSVRALDGMDIDTRSEEVRAARRDTLRMLLSEHAGDCEAPCRRICPASLDIPRMMRLLVAGKDTDAAQLARRGLVFPATLGHICSAPCEKGCRRGAYDAPLAIRACHREFGEVPPPPCDRAASTGKRIAVIGAGLAGLAAAFVCIEKGHAVRVFEKRASACDHLRQLPPDALPPSVIDNEVNAILDMGAELTLDREISDTGALAADFDAVIVACNLEPDTADNIFSANEHAMPVRAVANGKSAARATHDYLRGVNDGPARRYNSLIAKLHPEELAAYAVERLRPPQDVSIEAARCLNCDCRKPASCKLRQYAEEYGVESPVKRHMERPPVEAIEVFGRVLFEAGKCIKCGICVELTDCLTFSGRGLASRIVTPFGAGPDDAAAVRCARACPTGALAVRGEEDDP